MVGEARNESPEARVKRLFGDLLVAGKSYPGDLPAELAPWYCYTLDGGHSIVVALEEHAWNAALRGDAISIDDLFVPVPVRAVLRVGYSIQDGAVWCALPYDPELGVITEEGDDEY